jgi:hypothetical protein
MSMPIRDKIEQYFCDQLNGHVDGITFSPSRADVDDMRPPYGVVVTDNLEEAVRGSFNYSTDIKIAVITDINRSTTSEHKALVARLLARLNELDYLYDSEDLSIHGFVIMGMSDVQGDEDDSYADVVNLRCGARG